ncbi:NADH:flavin oxidoreductase [Methanosarcina sp. DH1]|uniref:NADH:flavin oxidoreductase n=1 Tax=Methanosarcina sp. DH1 TaxID=2605695 RepID=UPI0021048FF0|nr:NADH:flavin oxidoreductase [Methanosarcina sp. DH1]MCC4768265.1 NADH:flavin oxidoreductase [Methanosarcina sp. DH1]
MTEITDELVIRGNHIKNRIVMPPMVTFSFHGDNGSYYGKQHIEHYTKRAKGGAGLIIVQATSVFGAIDSTGMWSPGDISALKQIVSNCHEYGATVMMQLHCGNMDINELSTEEIHSMQKNMKRAAIRACEIGFDGVEFHFAHGFTLCKFLDASYNRRTDKYGGDALYRARVLTQILPEIRNNTHYNFIISVRMGEYLPASKDGIEAVKAFEKAGIDLLHISFGMQPPANPVPDGFICSPITYSGCKIKKEVKIPVIAVNGIRTEEQVRFLIENNYVDFAAVGRGMLADPNFANHVINGEPVNTCLGCERCFWFTDDTLCPAKEKE